MIFGVGAQPFFKAVGSICGEEIRRNVMIPFDFPAQLQSCKVSQPSVYVFEILEENDTLRTFSNE